MTMPYNTTPEHHASHRRVYFILAAPCFHRLPARAILALPGGRVEAPAHRPGAFVAPAMNETMRHRRSAWRIWSALALLALTSLAVASACGSRGCSPVAGLQALFGSDDPLAREIILRLRLPRALAGFAVGGLLALAGALMQVLLRNPLADPYVLGVSGGASLAALLAIWAGAGSIALLAASWAGALVSIAALFALGRGSLRLPVLLDAAAAPTRLLLTGVMLASLWGALVTLVLTLAPDARLRGMLFWLIGELSGAAHWGPAMLALGVSLAVALGLARSLNTLLAGDARAQSLGVEVARLRAAVCLLGAVATAFAVTTAGSLGFVGLLVPHALRRACGNDQRILLPACVLGGGSLVVVADTLARTLVAPQQLPVGAIMALVGVPAFLALLWRAPGPAR
jgi:iron complex transport system permease protein